jgi:hypothetical protein
MLLGRVVREDVDPTEVALRLLHRRSAKFLPSDIPRDEQTFAPLTFN